MPGKLYFPDPDRAWPGDTINQDGTARTPMWKQGLEITPDQYDLVQDRSDPEKRAKWGTLFFLDAKEGSEFYDRMASWPVAFDDAIRDACDRHFPPDEWTIYVHGHSTGGPFVHNMLQRIDNVAGLIGRLTGAAVRPGPSGAGVAGAPDALRLDLTRVNAEFGEHDEIALEEGLAATIAWQRRLYPS